MATDLRQLPYGPVYLIVSMYAVKYSMVVAPTRESWCRAAEHSDHDNVPVWELHTTLYDSDPAGLGPDDNDF